MKRKSVIERGNYGFILENMVSFSDIPFLMASLSLLVVFFSPLLCLARPKRKNITQVVHRSTVENLWFPFNNKTNPECRLYTVDCSELVLKIHLTKGGHWYEMVYTSLFGDYIDIKSRAPPTPFTLSSCESNESYALPSPFMLANLSSSNLLTVLKCSHSPVLSTLPRDFYHSNCRDYDIYYTLSNFCSSPFPPQCSMIQLPGYEQTPDREISSLPLVNLEVHVNRYCYDCYNHKKGYCQINYDKDNLYCGIPERKGTYIRACDHVLFTYMTRENKHSFEFQRS